MVRPRTERERLAGLVEQFEEAKLRKAEFGEEISRDTGYGYIRKKRSKRLKNPFEKCLAARQAQAEKKHGRRKREAEVLQQLEDLEAIKAEFGEAISPSTDYEQYIPTTIYKKPRKRRCLNPFMKYMIKRQIKAEKEQARRQIEAKLRQQLRDIELAKAEITRAELAKAELAELAKAELGEEINVETDYVQYRRKKRCKLCKNPFKKYVNKLKIKADKKRARRQREAEMRQQLRDMPLIKTELRFREEPELEEYSEMPYETRKTKKRKRFKCIKCFKKPKHKEVTESYSDYDVDYDEYAPTQEEFIKTKVERSKPEYKEEPLTEYYGTNDDYEPYEPKRVKKIKKRKRKKVKKAKKVKKTKVKRKKRPFIKYSDSLLDEDDEIYEGEIINRKIRPLFDKNKPMIFKCNNKKCKHLYCIKKRHDIEYDETRKLTKKERKILQRRICAVIDKRYFNKIMNESHYPTAKHG